MHGHQEALFNWMSSASGTTGFVVLATGAIYAFLGFRLHRVLLGLTSAVIGLFAGALLANLFGLDGRLPMAILAIAFGLTGIRAHRAATAIICGLTWAALGVYLGEQLRLDWWWPTILLSLSGVFGVLFAVLCPRTTPLVLTTVQGAALMVLGVVGFTTDYFPSFGRTFQSWAASWPLVAPILLVTLTVTAYSIQRSHQQGDIISGTT